MVNGLKSLNEIETEAVAVQIFYEMCIRDRLDLAGTPVFGGILENCKETGQGRRDPAGE